MDFKPHTVLQGERWDTIAQFEYGDSIYTPDIQMANIEIALDVPLEPGTVLRIPIKEAIPETQKELMPPWKQ